jgi:hypothetical protein
MTSTPLSSEEGENHIIPSNETGEFRICPDFQLTIRASNFTIYIFKIYHNPVEGQGISAGVEIIQIPTAFPQ